MVVVIVVLLLALSNGSSRRSSRATEHERAVSLAKAADVPFTKAANDLDRVQKAVAADLKDAVSPTDDGRVRAGAQREADALTRFTSQVLSIKFPASMEQDVRALLTAAGSYRDASLSVASPGSDLSSAVVAGNQAFTVFNNAYTLVVRDIANFTGVGFAPVPSTTLP